MRFKSLPVQCDVCGRFSVFHGVIQDLVSIYFVCSESCRFLAPVKLGKVPPEKLKEAIPHLPFHMKLIVKSLKLLPKGGFTGEVYEKYACLAVENKAKLLTQRRVSGLLNELAEIGIVKTKLVSLGRYGRSKWNTLLIKEVE